MGRWSRRYTATVAISALLICGTLYRSRYTNAPYDLSSPIDDSEVYWELTEGVRRLFIMFEVSLIDFSDTLDRANLGTTGLPYKRTQNNHHWHLESRKLNAPLPSQLLCLCRGQSQR